jgi:hypothetical protein
MSNTLTQTLHVGIARTARNSGAPAQHLLRSAYHHMAVCGTRVTERFESTSAADITCRSCSRKLAGPTPAELRTAADEAYKASVARLDAARAAERAARLAVEELEQAERAAWQALLEANAAADSNLFEVGTRVAHRTGYLTGTVVPSNGKGYAVLADGCPSPVYGYAEGEWVAL